MDGRKNIKSTKIVEAFFSFLPREEKSWQEKERKGRRRLDGFQDWKKYKKCGERIDLENEER